MIRMIDYDLKLSIMEVSVLSGGYPQFMDVLGVIPSSSPPSITPDSQRLLDPQGALKRPAIH